MTHTKEGTMVGLTRLMLSAPVLALLAGTLLEGDGWGQSRR